MSSSLFESCEHAIGLFSSSSLSAALALRLVNDNKFYQAVYPSFEAYCAERWDIKRSQAYRLIDASSVLEDISGLTARQLFDCPPLGDTSGCLQIGDSVNCPPLGDIPKNERQCRPLVHLTKDERVKVWASVMEKTSTGKRLSQSLVAATVAEFKGVDMEETSIRIPPEFLREHKPRPYVQPGKNNPGFFQIYNEIIDIVPFHLGPTSALILFAVFRHINPKTGIARVPDKDLEQKTRLSSKSLALHIKTLSECMFFERSGSPENRIYKFYDLKWVLWGLGWQDMKPKNTPASMPAESTSTPSGSHRWKENLSQVQEILQTAGLSLVDVLRVTEKSGSLNLLVHRTTLDAFKSVVSQLEKLFSMPVTVRV